MLKKAILVVVKAAFLLLFAVVALELTTLLMQHNSWATTQELVEYCLERAMNPSVSAVGNTIEFRCEKPR